MVSRILYMDDGKWVQHRDKSQTIDLDNIATSLYGQFSIFKNFNSFT